MYDLKKKTSLFIYLHTSPPNYIYLLAFWFCFSILGSSTTLIFLLRGFAICFLFAFETERRKLSIYVRYGITMLHDVVLWNLQTESGYAA